MKLIRLLRRLPIKWQHKLRLWGQMAEYYSEMLVLTEGEGTMALIEGRTDPDFAEYDRRVTAMQARWGIYDADLQRYVTNRRWVEFKLGLAKKMENNS
jgi:hypothetical protein